jgi:hypothetical protein
VRPFGTNIILLWSRGGRFATAAADPRLSRDIDAVQGYQADAQTGLVLLWQAHYLAVLDVKTPEGEPELERLRLPYAKDIQQAFFVLGKAGILYRDGDSTFLANRLQDDEWRTSFVVTARMGTSVYYSEREGKLYYIDQTTGRLATTDIVPQEQLIDQIVQQLRQDSGH